ncbi:hypothetical protein CCM_08961 [Cordyceps militaris CM01]|uniref:Uncharacterized protein n=1 Tax=Cordyceps militaris (strain CM01) TaxID=983644 RepID=G3JSR8_CORMM|nr:uncharacterized protein CCM_08961 [Cordyceps militaris CM01]EGX88914.1 hypothetical protein CCM_08961 [Cordyceps militaris CM01]
MSPIRPRRCPHLAINNRHPPPPRSFAPLPTRGEELGNKLGTPQSSRARRTAGFRTHPVATSSSFRLTLPRPQDIRTSRNAKSDPRIAKIHDISPQSVGVGFLTTYPDVPRAQRKSSTEFL